MVWKIKPTNSNEVLPKEAINILRKLEMANNNNQKRKYNKILKDLRAAYPDKAHLIESHFVQTNNNRGRKHKQRTLLQQAMSLSPEEKSWIRSWKDIQGR
jgi:RNA polymerase-interacting CarD/CdnL/TRCF family regulator